MSRSVRAVLCVGVGLTTYERRAEAQQPPPPPQQAQPNPYPYGYPPPGYAYPPPGYGYPPPGYAPVPVVVAPPGPPKTDSVNASPLGVVFGSYSLNYEHLASGTHGLMAELSTFRATQWSQMGDANGITTTNGSARVLSGGVGYRWHWSRQQDSGFLGFLAGYGAGSGTSTLTRNGVASQFDVSVKAPWFVVNIGRRWQWDNGLNLTLRIGGGRARYKVSTTSSDPDAQMTISMLQDLLDRFPIAIDTELSLGYSF